MISMHANTRLTVPFRLRHLVLFLCMWATASLVCPQADAATRRALLIGINSYSAGPGSSAGAGGRGVWTDLNGAVNDIHTLKEILMANYGFPRQNIQVLTDKQATRDAILSAYRRSLIDPVQPGDVCVFYYAGHGSQVRNSRTDEPDGKDETIVPADSSQGKWDIRDKELSRLFNDTLDRRANLTVLFDSCHSGSIARGDTPGLARWLPGDNRDIAAIIGNEKPDPRGAPEQRKNGALILSAAQDYQLAYEATDARGQPHGSFSLALQRALIAGPGQSAASIYKRVRGLMQAEGLRQDPVLAGPVERFSQPLFGLDGGEHSGETTVAVLRVKSKEIELEGGAAIGLHEDCELVKVGEESVRVRISSLSGLNGAKAQIVKGRSSDIQKGDLFKLDKWTAPDEAHLRVFIPDSMTFAEITATAGAMKSLKSQSGILWVDKPTEHKPTHEMHWDGRNWQLDTPGGKTVKLGKSPRPDEVADAIRKSSSGSARFFLNLPPAPALRDTLLANLDARSTIRVANKRSDAHYILMGRSFEGLPEYAWVLPASTVPGARTDTLPARGDWIQVSSQTRTAENAGMNLWNHALSLGRIRAWITLNAPPDGGRFPYQLKLRNLATGRYLDSGSLHESESFQLMLVKDPNNRRRMIEKRFVYVFVLDSFGNSYLMFPALGQGNVENTLPYSTASGSTPEEIPLGDPIQIGPPFGIDTYVLLTSKEMIPNPDLVLHAQGVRTRGGGADSGALGSLLQGIGGSTRGVRKSTPVNWGIERLTFESRP